MFGWLFGKKRELEEINSIKEEAKKGFESVKHDMHKVGNWIEHLNSQQDVQKNDISEVKQELASVKLELLELRDFFNLWNSMTNKQVFKQRQTPVGKQTAVEAVQTGVQTAVQTDFFDNLSVNERHIVWILLNTDMNLSYEDVASMLGKDKSTIRGQINAIRQKSEGLVEEMVEKNGKKRIYIPEKIKNTLIRGIKLKSRVNSRKSEKY